MVFQGRGEQYTMKRKTQTAVLLMMLVCPSWGYKEAEDVAVNVNGIEIPIMILSPDEGTGPFPVVYHVHGGGWNGGTETVVPDAGLPPESKTLCDQLGIIYVGLAYRCKAQGTFEDAMEDLRASITWFEGKAAEFNADTSRVGFSGGSAGTPLSAILAQEMPTCKTYVGLFGVYNLLDNEASLFPDEEACEKYGLASTEQKRAASAYHHVRENPPATRLFHGAKDILTHPTQSSRFAELLKQKGADAKVTIYPEVNHGYFNPRNPDEFKDSTLQIAVLYAGVLKDDSSLIKGLDARLDQMLERYYPLERIDEDDVPGRWGAKRETLEFKADGTGVSTDHRGKSTPFAYVVKGGTLQMNMGDQTTDFFMQTDRRAIYRITAEGRHAGKKEHYMKRTE